MEKKDGKKGKKKKKKGPDEKIILEENSGKFSLNIFRGLIAR